MDTTRHPWPHDELSYDFQNAVCGNWVDTRLVGLGAPRMDPLREGDVVETTRWHVAYGDRPWRLGEQTGTELTLVAVLRLRDGGWASVEAWNDQYRADVVLTDAGRVLLDKQEEQ